MILSFSPRFFRQTNLQICILSFSGCAHTHPAHKERKGPTRQFVTFTHAFTWDFERKPRSCTVLPGTVPHPALRICTDEGGLFFSLFSSSQLPGLPYSSGGVRMVGWCPITIRELPHVRCLVELELQHVVMCM